MTLKSLAINIHGPKRDTRARMEPGAAPRPELVHAPRLVPLADASPAPEEQETLAAAIDVPEPPSAQHVADAVYRMMLEEAQRARLRRGA